MKYIKLALISAFVMCVIITVISVFIPSRISISKTINVLAPKDSVFGLIKNTERWNQWYPAYKNYQVSEERKKIDIKTTAITDSVIVMQMQQEGKNPITSAWQVLPTPFSDSLTLQWYMEFHLKWYPWQKISGLFYNKVVGHEMENGLNNIREIVHE